MVRHSELSAARRGALAKLQATQSATPDQTIATLIDLDASDSRKVRISLGGPDDLKVLAPTGKMVPGSLVSVQLDDAGRPIRVLGPLTDRPAGLDAEADAPAPVHAWPTLAPAEISDEEREAIIATANDLAETQQDLAAATTDIETVVKPGISEAVDTAQQAADDATAALVAASDAAADARNALDDAVLRIDSSRGTAFKNNTISTVLSVTIIRGGQLITDIDTLWDIYGSAAYVEWWWRRIGDTDFGVISSADNRLSNAGFSLTVSPSDVDEQTVFQCILHT